MEFYLVSSGIPQGSVLGPILLSLVINDSVESCENHAEIYLFADDAKLFKHIFLLLLPTWRIKLMTDDYPRK